LGVQSQLGDQQPTKFEFKQNFAILSLLCIVIIGSASAFLMLRFLTSHILERDAVLTMDFIQSEVDIGGVDLFSLPRPAQHDGIAELVAPIAYAADVLRATVHASDGTVAWSTDPNLIGKYFSDNPDLERALAGELVFNFVERDESEKEEHDYFPIDVTAFVESYFPIFDPTGAEVIGVVEVYRAPSVLIDAVKSVRWTVWGAVATAGLLLYFSLFWIVHRANALMNYQQERLAESETVAAIGEMTSAVAHGVRNPLASIRSSAELGLEEDDPVISKEIAQDIIAEADRMENWLRELIRFAHPNHEEFVRVDLSDLIRSCVAGFANAMKKRGVQLDLSVGDPVCPIRGDAALLDQLLNNVISNALEAMPNGGRLAIGLRTTRNEKAVEIIVSDSGHGIPKTQLKQVFKPFMTTKKGGFGLGLLLVKRICERHNGTIDLSSDVGRGTSVFLRFPGMIEP
jgi:signal transduction histidine kinase